MYNFYTILVLLCYCYDDTIVEKCSLRLKLSMSITAALSTFTLKVTSKMLVTCYVYFSKVFVLYFYFYLSKKMIQCLYFYSSTRGKYFLQHWRQGTWDRKNWISYDAASKSWALIHRLDTALWNPSSPWLLVSLCRVASYLIQVTKAVEQYRW